MFSWVFVVQCDPNAMVNSKVKTKSFRKFIGSNELVAYIRFSFLCAKQGK